MSYGMILKPSAERQLARLPRKQQMRIIESLSAIRDNPRLFGSHKLSGSRQTYRYRVGDYRIVYELDDGTRVVYVTIIAHRRDVYRDL
jgi:mRNA interferase RelE/StbE